MLVSPFEEEERSSLRCSVGLRDLNVGLGANEDTIEEFTVILAADSADLLDLRACLGEGVEVDTVEDNLTLDVGGEVALGALLHVDDLVLLSTEEVLNGDGVTVLGDDAVDGEMGVDHSHFVAETLNKTSEGQHLTQYVCIINN